MHSGSISWQFQLRLSLNEKFIVKMVTVLKNLVHSNRNILNYDDSENETSGTLFYGDEDEQNLQETTGWLKVPVMLMKLL